MAGFLRALDRKKTQHLIFIGLFLLIEILLLRRSFYGFNTSDEMYFIGTSERIFRGEKILIDEWNPTQQLCSFLLHPIYCLIRIALGNTEGIVMASRFFYLAFEAVLTIFLYLRLQRRGFASYGPVFLFLLYAPFGICAMSYNSIECGILTVLLAVLSARMEHSVPEYLLCGILMAVIVLANPFAILMYFAYGLICLVVTVRNHRMGRETEGVLQFKNFLWMTLGAGIILLLFILFVFQRGTLSEMLANIPHIVGDSEHKGGGVWYKIERYFYLCFKNYRYMFCALGVIYAATLLDRKRFEHSLVYMVLASLAVLPYLIYYGFIFDHITVNYQMLPLAFWCLEAYFVTEHKEKRLFYWWYLPSMLFTLIVQFATNTGIVTISVAYSLCSCIGLLFVTRWLQEIRERISDKQSRFVLANLWKEKKFLQSSFVAFICSVIFFQFAGTFYLRMTYAWGDSPMETLTQAMERGPLKGVYTSPKTANWYGEVLEELDMLHLTQEDQLMVFGVAPWIYLYVDAGCGNYSTWQVHENSTQIYDYYGLHPDKFPNVIYMAHWADIFLECELSNQFKERGYELVYEGTGTVMMSPERAQKYEKGV
ncbi:MAG: hypothetical protein HFJ10_14420 [Lachnospiraceae bacterium]|nr:hypothetical protein [Lachnospiraceae bacterium]